MTAAPIPSADLAKASLDRLDAMAAAMERKWGVGRLAKLVDASLAARFGRQAERLDAAIRDNQPEIVSVQAEAMLRAWTALDRAAVEGGWKPLAPTVWETVLPETGEVVAIVRDADEAHAVAKERAGTIWTLAEVAIAIEAFGDTVRETKHAFPGAAVKSVRPASLPIGSAPPVAAAETTAKRASANPARNPRRRPAGVTSVHAPLFETSPDTPSSAPPIDWSRGDDVPF